MKKVVVILSMAVIFSVVIFLSKERNILAEDQPASSSFGVKLDVIIQNQEKILNKLDSMSRELEKIKIRTSVR